MTNWPQNWRFCIFDLIFTQNSAFFATFKATTTYLLLTTNAPNVKLTLKLKMFVSLYIVSSLDHPTKRHPLDHNTPPLRPQKWAFLQWGRGAGIFPNPLYYTTFQNSSIPPLNTVGGCQLWFDLPFGISISLHCANNIRKIASLDKTNHNFY